MEHINIIGYFKEAGQPEETKEELLYMVVYENSYNQSEADKNNNIIWYEGYNVIDGHFQLQDTDYLEECERITKEEYKEATKSFYTPEAFL